MDYYRRYVGDYLRDTSRLSMLEHGAYTLLLDYYYADAAPLPLDHDEIYTMVRAMSEPDRAAVDKILGRYFERHPDGYHNSRADEELHIATAVIATAKANGKLGGRPKRNPEHNPQDNPEETQTITRDKTQTVTREEPRNNHPPTANHHPPSSNHQPTSKALLRASRLPPSWTLPEPWLAWAKTEKPTWTLGHIRASADRFRDYWISKAGKDAAKLDWEATWRNWMRRESDPRGGTGPPNGKSAKEAEAERFVREMTGSKRDGNDSREAIDGTAERIAD